MVLDENLRILGRRINDLELDIEDKKDKIRFAESQNNSKSAELANVHSK
jgi:hypothetical protein